MELDALGLSALRAELSDLLVGGRVQRIVQPSPLSLGLEIYTGLRQQLLLSAEAQAAGAFMMEIKLRRGTENPSPFLLLLRKRLQGARLLSVTQPPLERMLVFDLSAPSERLSLVCEAMGRLSNLILVDEQGLILDAAKRVPPSINRYRTILPHQPYVAPPPQRKEHPLSLSAGRLDAYLDSQEGPLWRRLISTVAGIGPLLAREIVFRATGSVDAIGLPDAQATQRLLDAILDLLGLADRGGFQPHVGYQEADDLPTAFAAYELRQYARSEPAPSMSEAVRRVWEAQGAYDAYAQVRERLQGIITGERTKQEARVAALERALASQAEVERLQVSGSAILAMGWSLTLGQTELVVDPVQLGLATEWPAGELRIRLDPGLSPAENAQAFFGRYRKLQRADEQVPQLRDEARLEIEYLNQLSAEVALAQDRPELDEVERELEEAGYLSRRRKAGSPAPGGPLRVRMENGDLVLVGRNSRQNHALTFREAGPLDLWLHAHGVPGGHVIVKFLGVECAPETLQRAAELAAYYSAGRDAPRVQVDWTLKRHVRAIKGARPGMVTYTHEQTLVVSPRSEDDLS